jgi:hypothetical protein
MGRFMSPDWSESPDAVPYADLENPQSFNLYSYVQNNPLSNDDPDGHVKCRDGSNADACVDADPDPPLPTINWNVVGQIARRTLEVATQAVHQIGNIMNMPGGPGCLGASVASGAMAGSGTAAAPGLLGIAGGPAVLFT